MNKTDQRVIKFLRQVGYEVLPYSEKRLWIKRQPFTQYIGVDALGELWYFELFVLPKNMVKRGGNPISPLITLKMESCGNFTAIR